MGDRTGLYCPKCDALKFGGSSLSDHDFLQWASDHKEIKGCEPLWITTEDALAIMARRRQDRLAVVESTPGSATHAASPGAQGDEHAGCC